MAFAMYGCVTAPAVCTTKAIRYTEAQIDALSDVQVKDNLANNEQLAREGCAVPNKR